MSKPTVLMIGAYPEWDMPSLERAYDLRKFWLAADKEAFLAEAGPDARAIATRGELGASGALIDLCPKLEIISCYGVGVDAIDLERARARGVRVTNTPDVLTEDVADFAFALILAHMRKVIEGDAHVRSGAWRAGTLPLGASLRGKTLGILGFGRIGRAIARRAEGFGVTIAYSDVPRRPACPTPITCPRSNWPRRATSLSRPCLAAMRPVALLTPPSLRRSVRTVSSSTSRAARWSTKRP
jgi:lactate dehydrogenase-like 2-hydroxyacid dehydrogenase